MGTTAERRAARERVSAYYEAQLAELIGHVGATLDRFRAGGIDAYDVDECLHQYHKAARELWKFCWLGGSGNHVELVADTLDRLVEPVDWWERGAPRARR